MKTLLVLLGPTGVGKTDVALDIAQRYGVPVVNADSRQMYKDLPIGTAAPTEEQQQRAKHYFVGTLNLDDYYNASIFEKEANEVIDDVLKCSDVALLSGGSMMYIDAVCNGIDNIPDVDPEIRTSLKQQLEREGLETLLEELRLADPQYYESVDRKNPRRVIHALEICRTTGQTYTSFRRQKQSERPYAIVKIGLTRQREELFERINQRTYDMVDNGLIEEARRVYPYKGLNSLNTVGYKEMFSYFEGQMDLSAAIARIQKNTRVYCKKQLTWFKRDEGIRWFHPDNRQIIFECIDKCINQE